MFWRERERESEERSGGGPPFGQVRVLVVGDSGRQKRFTAILNNYPVCSTPLAYNHDDFLLLVHLVGIWFFNFPASSNNWVYGWYKASHIMEVLVASSNSNKGNTERISFVELWDVSDMSDTKIVGLFSIHKSMEKKYKNVDRVMDVEEVYRHVDRVLDVQKVLGLESHIVLIDLMNLENRANCNEFVAMSRESFLIFQVSKEQMVCKPKCEGGFWSWRGLLEKWNSSGKVALDVSSGESNFRRSFGEGAKTFALNVPVSVLSQDRCTVHESDAGYGAREDEDKVVWTKSRSGVFSVKSLYSILEPEGSTLFPYDNIWRAYVPPKVAFFAWEASWGKILTLEQLQRSGYSLPNRCFLCLSEAETVDHLLLYCVKTRTLWNLLFFLFGVAWVLLVQLRKLSLDGMEHLWGKLVKRKLTYDLGSTGNGTFSAPLGSAGPCGLPVPFIVIGNKVDIATKEGQRGSSGNLVDVARQWVEKQGLLPSSEELPLTESFPGSGGLIAVQDIGYVDQALMKINLQ
ncbi:Small GTPase LIP1 [Vitis vinifera]|uniref:Small GTPase LIP1 n=1 Tax=Vitis vinifera TaxID=29760 RepID=A0A438CE92_VITVI|nr:Small GTPase LIP1 [Vitis vinifera]